MQTLILLSGFNSKVQSISVLWHHRSYDRKSLPSPGSSENDFSL